MPRMTMKHSELTNDLQEQASLYAAGALTETERQEYVRHLEDDRCAVCRAEVDELQATMSMVAFSAPLTGPSPSVRERLMEQARTAGAREERKPAAPFLRRHWLEFLTSIAAAGAIVVALAATNTASRLRRLTETLNSRIAQLEVQLARNATYIATLTSPDVRVVNLTGQGANVQASGRIFWDQKQKHWFFYVKDLPQVPRDKSYELWFVPKTGNPVKAIVFNTGPNGSTEVDIDVPEGLDLRAAAVTTEPAGGTDAPTGAFALLGAM
jgi:anti-sigma-K factor RskA